jgi:copper chaperone CopZ
MQIPFPKLALAVGALLSLAVTGVRAEDKAAATKSATFKVTGMVCGSCEASLKEATTKVEGVKSIEANAEKGTAVVAYDPAKTTEEKIAAAINATKYKIAK